MIIDFHVHTFPDKLAPKVIPKLAEMAGIEPQTDATVSDTLAKMKEWGVDRAVLLNIATAPTQQTTINNVSSENNRLPFYTFGSVHPDAEDKIDELKRIKKLGIYGIKLHPEYQNFFIDDEKALPIYEECQALGLPITFHAGCDLGFEPPVHATPDRMRKIIDMFPNLTVIAAHFGGYRCWDMVDHFLVGKNIYFDTSFTANEIDPMRMKEMILRHGTDKVLFASDCPWKKMSDSIDHIEKMGLTAADSERIFYKNALEILEK
ncbi:MAG: amidohydrolase family protein [Clostridia bacterium]|nr:amidohydrolase family protein [Clostridia bacterium]